MLLLWFVLFLTVKKKWSTMWNKNLHDYIHASIPAPLRLDIFATWKCRPWTEYGPEMSGPKTGIELSKTEITKIEENLDETVKHCLK